MELSKTLTIPNIKKIMKRISLNKNVHGYVFTSAQGSLVAYTLDSHSAVKYSNVLRNIATWATNACQEINPLDEVIAVRLATKKHEIFIKPDREFQIAVIMRPPKMSPDYIRTHFP